MLPVADLALWIALALLLVWTYLSAASAERDTRAGVATEGLKTS